MATIYEDMHMNTIYEDMHGIEPKIEKTKSQFIIQKYARNKGVNEAKSSEYFGMLWQPFAWAAILGFIYNKRKALKGEIVSHFKYSTINTNGSDIFYSLVLFAVAKEGYEILNDSKKVNNVIEEYANGGFEVIATILKEKGADYFGYDKNFLEEVISRKNIVSSKTKNVKLENKEIEVSDGTQFEI